MTAGAARICGSRATGGVIRLVPDPPCAGWCVSRTGSAVATRGLAAHAGDIQAAVAALAQRYPHGLPGREPPMRDPTPPWRACFSPQALCCWPWPAGGVSLRLAERLLHLGAVWRPSTSRRCRLRAWWPRPVAVYPPPCAAGAGWWVCWSWRAWWGWGKGWRGASRMSSGGFLLRWWTTGVVGLALIPGLTAGVLLAPWPLSGRGVALGLGCVVALVLYSLAAGRPYVP